MKTTWYLHSHFVCLKLSYSSIDGSLFVCLAAHEPEFHRWASAVQPRLLPELSNFYCLPGRAGGSPLVISGLPARRLDAGTARQDAESDVSVPGEPLLPEASS